MAKQLNAQSTGELCDYESSCFGIEDAPGGAGADLTVEYIIMMNICQCV